MRTTVRTPSGPRVRTLTGRGRSLSDALKVPEVNIRVIALRHVGGGFGNKGAGHIEPIVASLAKATGRPVKISLTREEVFTSTSVRHPAVAYIKDAVKNDGTILGRQIKLIYNGGAYSLAGNVAVGNSIHGMTSVYRLPNLKADIYRVYTNQVQGGAFRGFGAPQIYFAIESQMDIIARTLHMDPIEFRRKNLLHDGEKTAIGHKITNNTIEECIAKVVDAVTRKTTSKRGRRLEIRNWFCHIKGAVRRFVPEYIVRQTQGRWFRGNLDGCNRSGTGNTHDTLADSRGGNANSA